ncbi:MAG: DUF3987 domain-containing protein [Planctomycetota bacterium]
MNTQGRTAGWDLADLLEEHERRARSRGDDWEPKDAKVAIAWLLAGAAQSSAPSDTGPSDSIASPGSRAEQDEGRGPFVRGNRNNALYAIGRDLRRRGVSNEAMEQSLQVINGRECDEPLPESEVRGIARGLEQASVEDLYEPFPVSELAPPLVPFVKQASESASCDPAYVALPSLAVMAAGVGNSLRAGVHSDWVEPCVLWTMVSGRSGTAESPAMKHAFSAAERLERKWIAEHKERIGKYMARAKEGGKGSPERNGRPSKPQRQRLLCHDVTIEAAFELTSRYPRGLLCRRDEGAAWLTSMGKYSRGSSADMLAWNELWDGQSGTLDLRTGEQRELIVPLAAMSVAVGIQPQMLRQVVGTAHVASGFTARFLIAEPPPRRRRFDTPRINADTKRRVSTLLDRLRRLPLRRNEDGTFLPSVVSFTARAYSVFGVFFDEMTAWSEAVDSDEECQIIAKLPGQAARLALVDAAICWANGSSRSIPGAIEVDALRRAVSLARWFGKEAIRIRAAARGKGEVSVSALQSLLEYIREKGGQITPNKLCKSRRIFKNNDEAKAQLDQLVELGQLVHLGPRRDGSSGRPPNLYVIPQSGGAKQ